MYGDNVAERIADFFTHDFSQSFPSFNENDDLKTVLKDHLKTQPELENLGESERKQFEDEIIKIYKEYISHEILIKGNFNLNYDQNLATVAIQEIIKEKGDIMDY